MTYKLSTGIKNGQPIATVLKMRGYKVIWRKDFAADSHYEAKDMANMEIQRCIEDDNWNAMNRD